MYHAPDGQEGDDALEVYVDAQRIPSFFYGYILKRKRRTLGGREKKILEMSHSDYSLGALEIV
jgi:hypothetical protein